MNRNVKFVFFIVLITLQLIQNSFTSFSHINLDFTYLIIIFIALKSSLIKTGIAATILGLLTDFTSGGILGVFGFSRTLIAFLIRGIISLIDLKKGSSVFIITTISLSISNLIANFLMFIISNYSMNIYFVLLQPFLTGLLTLLILKIPYLRKQLDVY